MTENDRSAGPNLKTMSDGFFSKNKITPHLVCKELFEPLSSLSDLKISVLLLIPFNWRKIGDHCLSLRNKHVYHCKKTTINGRTVDKRRLSKSRNHMLYIGECN